MQPESGESKPIAEHLRADVAGLRGVHGTMLLRLQSRDVGSLLVNDRHADFSPEVRESQVVVEFEEANDVKRLLSGELNPIVASLQQRMHLSGDLVLGAQIILGLSAGAEFKPTERGA